VGVDSTTSQEKGLAKAQKEFFGKNPPNSPFSLLDLDNRSSFIVYPCQDS